MLYRENPLFGGADAELMIYVRRDVRRDVSWNIFRLYLMR